MRFLILFLTLALLVSLPACASRGGPGVGSSCAEEAAVGNPTGAGSAGNAVSGGQRPSSEGEVGDIARVKPFFPISRGTGNQEVTYDQAEGRTVTTGPAITQALQAPATGAAQGNSGSAISQSVLQYRQDIEALQADAAEFRKMAQTAFTMGKSDDGAALIEQYNATVKQVSAMQQKLVAAERGCAQTITQIYFQDGQKVVMSNVSGTSGAGGDPKKQPGAVSDTAAAVTGAALGPVGAAAMADDARAPTSAESRAMRASALRAAADALEPGSFPKPDAQPDETPPAGPGGTPSDEGK